MSSITAKTSSSNSADERSAELINDTGHIVTPGMPMPKRHRFIRNGTFKSILNGDSFTPATAGTQSSTLTIDSWFLKQFGGCVANVARGISAFTDVQAMYYSVINVISTAGANNFVIFEQREHDITKYAGKTISLSFLAKASKNLKIAVEISSDYNTAETKGSETVNIDLTTEYQRFDLRIPVPPIPGSTVGSLSKLITRFWLSSNGYEGAIGKINDGPAYFYFANIEDGSRISEPSVYEEQDDVGRYFEKTQAIIPIANAGKTATTADLYGRVQFEVRKALFPTAGQITIAGQNNITSPSVANPTRGSFNVVGVASSSTSASSITGFTCNCELGE